MHTLDDAYTQTQVEDAGELWEAVDIASIADIPTEAVLLAKVIAIRANMGAVVQRLKDIMEVEGRQDDGGDTGGHLSVPEGEGVQGDGVGTVGDAEDEIPGLSTGEGT